MSESRPLFSSLSLEGEFTDWVHQFTRNLGALINLTTIHVDNFGTVYASDTGWGSYIVSRANVLTVNVGFFFDDMAAQLQQRRGSITSKYMIDVDAATQLIFNVWRYGVLIETVNTVPISADFSFIWHIAISPNGRYIAAAIGSTAGVNIPYVVLWMGE